ncbi:hypothetical protein CJ030_MR6G025620 [Morella rubra]|uniref:Uncharacterized protein n=1 Tax=Morella rubra TaxID=262757 RepID=A0A6A1VGA6_9ROSI|nr:hypothetical protein CJ030_MR6G025620 [Morella rubra]
MAYLCLLLLVVLFSPSACQLQNSQTQILLQLRKQLEYPTSLQILENFDGDFCSLSSSAYMSISCEESSVTELKIMGDKLAKVSGFNGFAIPNKTLSESFSIDSFVTTLTRLPSLRVLSLVSLGIWGPLPDKIHRLSSLELLDLSSNFMYGSIPPGISRLAMLHTLTLDGNYFNDTLPGWLDSFSNLTILSLKSNVLKGQIPSSVSKVRTLTDLALSHNELSGKLPDLSTLTSLQVLDLRENHLDSELPVMPKVLVTALLNKNSFSGKIREQLGELSRLQHLDLSFNRFSGTPPSALFSLPNISYLNLASNMLSGSLPNELSCGGKLGFVDISSNKLIGGLPSCLSSNSDQVVVKFGGNCFSIPFQHQHQGSYCTEAPTIGEQSRGRDIAVLVAVISGTVLLIILLVLGVLFLLRRCRLRRMHEQHLLPKIVQDNAPTGVSSELLANATADQGGGSAEPRSQVQNGPHLVAVLLRRKDPGKLQLHIYKEQKPYFKSGGDWCRPRLVTFLLVQAGIKFRKGTSESILDIEFVDGVLKIPPLLVYEATESVFRNIISFEQCYTDCEARLTSYAILIDSLINTANDVDILRENGIIDNWINPEDTVQFFSKLYHKAYVKTFYYGSLCNEVDRYCRRSWPRWRAMLVRNYFNSPWTVLSTLAAVLLLVLSFLQTWYTMNPPS